MTSGREGFREQLSVSRGRGHSKEAIARQIIVWEDFSPGSELLEALLVVRVVCVDVGCESGAGDAESSGLVEALDARSDLDTGLGGSADGAGSDTEEGHYGASGERG